MSSVRRHLRVAVAQGSPPTRATTTGVLFAAAMLMMMLLLLFAPSPSVRAFAPPPSSLSGSGGRDIASFSTSPVVRTRSTPAFPWATNDDCHGVDGEGERRGDDGDDGDRASRERIPTRREALLRSASLSATFASAVSLRRTQSASALDLPDLPDFLLPPDRRTDNSATPYKQAERATAYLVDSTIPPSLVPFRPSRESAVLKNLGGGSGTPKGPYLQERINLNNIMNKGVYGAGKAIGDLIRGGPEDPRSGRGYASFVFLGVNNYGSEDDADLARGILEDVIKPRRSSGNKELPTALGLAFAPRSTQGALDRYLRGEQTESELVDELASAACPSDRAAAATYLPLLRFAKSRNLSLLALAPEAEDIQTVRTRGLQNVDVDRRARYVLDSEGFINLTQDPKFRLYTEKSLLRDFIPLDARDSPGDYFAERILVHEACASALATWAVKRPDALVVAVAPSEDLRYMGGMNGRVGRVCRYLDPEGSIVDEECVTTILLNPTAESTLSASKFLRLEIGTSPDTIRYQTKLADYVWFSEMPRVNMLPRMMNYA